MSRKTTIIALGFLAAAVALSAFGFVSTENANAAEDSAYSDSYENDFPKVFAEPFYVGVAACGQCHGRVGGRNQFNDWYLSPHAMAHASLSHPKSEQILRLSGLDEKVYESPVCLGCHATAADSEAWERDPAFFLKDGVQCERCHGPGSEYMREEIMKNPEVAMRAGLKKPGKETCMICHEHKGSHDVLLGREKFEYEKAWKTIRHDGRGEGSMQKTGPSKNGAEKTELAGVMECARCHDGEKAGFAFGKWRLSSHAGSYARLATPRALKIAEKAGLKGDPQHQEECLRCHAAALTGDGVRILDFPQAARGVQCESCHGPGAGYMESHIMSDPAATGNAGLRDPSPADCAKCHAGFHGETFDYEKMFAKIAHSIPNEDAIASEAETYKTPFNLAVTRDGRLLLAACEASDTVIVIDAKARKILAEVPVGNLPHGICFSEDETRAYASNRGDDTVSEIDLETRTVTRTFSTGDEPHGLLTDRDDKHLYVANAGSNDISVIDLSAGEEIKRLSGGRGTWGMDISPDGRSIYVTNNLSHFVPFRTPSVSEVTVVDTNTATVKKRIMIPEANLVQGIDFAPDGEFALVTLLRTKNLVPIVRVIQGWVITNGIGVLWRDGSVDQLLLDEYDDYFADPTDVAITPDGKYAFVTGGGVNAVAAVDLKHMKEVLENADPDERKSLLPNHLGIPAQYVAKRIETGWGPRGLTVSPAGDFVYVADALGDEISVIDVEKLERVDVIDLEGPEWDSTVRLGERVFHNADATYGGQFTCHSCHPDGGVDGLTYDIEPDGLGLNPVDNRTLKGVLDTAPFKWTGKNPSLNRQCGPRLAVFFTRIDPFTPEQVKNLEQYICTIARNPNRYRAGDSPTPSQSRGKKIFERKTTNSREIIPVENRCDTCHPGPYFTNRRKTDVGTQSEIDTQGVFDVPHLNNIYETAPYLHDGRAETLEEIWTRFNPEDRHGVTNDMTKDQLNDLIEYLKTL